MRSKKYLSLLLAIVCLFAVTAGVLSGCKEESVENNKIQVSFDLNFKGSPEAPAAITVEKGKAYGNLPAVTLQREGYTFGGWYLNDSGKGDEVTANTVVTTEADHTLYAKWIGDKITVSFDLQGGNINGVSVVEDAVVTVGNVYSMMAIPDDPEKDSNSFLGWFYDPEGKEGPVLTSTKVTKTEDHTLYAVWQEYKSFYDFEEGGKEIFSNPGNVQYVIETYNGSNQLKVSNPGTDKPDGTLVMWIPLKTGTKVSMDVTFAGELPTEQARMNLFCYGVNASGVAITEGIIDITESETHRRWYHGNGYRAMQQNGAWFHGDEGNWAEGNTCKLEVIVMEDCAGLYMAFNLGSEMESSKYVKNAIYIDNIEMTPNAYRPLEVGMMDASPFGATEQGIYFVMKDNGVPYNADWSVYYSATDPNNVKLIRDGKVYRVAEVGCDNICKFSPSDYYLRLEPYTIGSTAAPISTTDMFIVEGDFTNGDTVMNVKKTYIYHNGTAWVFADVLPEELAPESEEATDIPDPYYGILRPHDAGATDSGIYFLLSDNGLPFDADWNIYYDATSADNVKIIRDGKVYRIAEVGCDNITKFGKADYYLRLESYTIGSYAPISNKDIFIVEGDFKYENSTLHINKTYIYHNGSSWVFTTKLPSHLAPDSEEVVADPYEGILRPHDAGATDSGIYFRLSDNGLPFDADWNIYYDATTADNLKIIRDGKVYRAAEVGCDNICKFDKDGYYLKLEPYTIGGYAPFTQKDIIVIEGDFVYDDSTLHINKTYIYYNGSEWVFTTQLPEDLQPGEGGEELGNSLGVLSAHSAGVNIDAVTNSITGVYATGTATDAPFNTDWSVEYTPAKAENYQLIRDGVTYNVGVPGNGTIVLFGQTELYLKQEGHTFGDGTMLPIRDGDILVVKGEWICNQDASATVTITKTCILLNEGTATFYEGEPDEEGGEEPGNSLGVLSAHSAGVNVDAVTNSITGVYATGAATDAPFNTDWSVEYTPAKAENYQLIRDGVTYNVGVPGNGTIVLFGQTELYLKQEGHTFGDGTMLPIRDGDILVVKGEWICNQDASATVTITKTCIQISEGGATFYEGEPDEEGGEDTEEKVPGLTAHTYGVNIDADTNSIKGIYATCADNSAAFNTDWSVEYTPAAVENYKLIRDGVTYNVGVPGNGTIVLFGQTDVYLKQEGHTFGDGTLLPIRDGDILVVEGQWNCNQDASSTLTIDTTYILISDNTALFSAELPEGALPEEPGEDDPMDSKWTFDFEDGQVSTDVFKLRESDLSMTVEELEGSMQLRLQPTVANGQYVLWLNTELKAGTEITLDVTFQRKLGTMNLYLYGAKENGDPITEGTASDTVPQVWFDGQGVDADFTGGNTNTQTITFTVYEDCHGITFMLGYGNKKPNVIYLDNITVTNAPAGEESGNQLGVLAAHTGGVSLDAVTGVVKGIYAVGAATEATFNTDWSVEYTPVKAENYQLIRDGVTHDVGVSGQGTLVMFGQTDFYLKQEGHTFGDGTLLPIQDGDILVVEGQWSCIQDVSSVIDITKTYILISDGSATFSDKEPGAEE